MHERLDGSGYPRRRTANQIHPLSKIAAVADLFVACISPRPHRPGMLPYHAMEHLIRSARNGEFDQSVVRALLHTVSLFPIGSCVEINDGSFGKVVRANRDAYTKPVVERWTPDSAILPATLVDLNSERDLRVVRAVTDLDSAWMNGDSAETAGHSVQAVNR